MENWFVLLASLLMLAVIAALVLTGVILWRKIYPPLESQKLPEAPNRWPPRGPYRKEGAPWIPARGMPRPGGPKAGQDGILGAAANASGENALSERAPNTMAEGETPPKETASGGAASGGISSGQTPPNGFWPAGDVSNRSFPKGFPGPGAAGASFEAPIGSPAGAPPGPPPGPPWNGGWLKEKSRGSGWTSRLATIAALALLMSIPLMLIGKLVDERSDAMLSTSQSLSQEWGPSQTLTGPLLAVPLTMVVETKEKQTAANGTIRNV